jgi:hypothetical protein
LTLGFGITTKDKRGLSVYRDGKRVPVKPAAAGLR